MRGSLLSWSGFLLLIAGVVFVAGLENEDLHFADNSISAVEVPLIEKHEDESYLQRIKRGIFDWFVPGTTGTTITTVPPNLGEKEKKEEPDNDLLGQLIDENADSLKEATTEQKTTVPRINSSLERKTRESGEENDIDGDNFLVDEEGKADRSNEIGHIGEGRRPEIRYNENDDEDIPGSGEAEGSAHDADLPIRPAPKTKFYRVTITIGEPYRRDYADRNSQEYKALSSNLSETLASLYRKEAPEDFTYVTVVKIENTTDAFKSQVTLDIGTSIPNEDDVRNVLVTNLDLHSLGNIQVSPEGFSFLSFQAGLVEPAPTPECDSLTELTCRSGNCVPLESRCDGVKNCDDGSDELDCHRTVGGDTKSEEGAESKTVSNSTERKTGCRADDQVQCFNETLSICAVQLCDGIPDCTNGTDERGCEYQGCSIGEFACDVWRCILESDRCNYKVDCRDGSDEHDCDYRDSVIWVPFSHVPRSDLCKEKPHSR